MNVKPSTAYIVQLRDVLVEAGNIEALPQDKQDKLMEVAQDTVIAYWDCAETPTKASPLQVIEVPIDSEESSPTVEEEPVYALTENQERAFVKFKKWWAEPFTDDTMCFVLRGYSGTGKTFLTALFQRWIDAMEGHGEVKYTTIHWCAPTHKAAQVLTKTLNGISDAGTLHALLGLRPVYNEDEITFEADPYAKNNIVHHSIIAVDEASMIAKDLVAITLERAFEYSCKILWIGDPGQINPVGESRSLSFSTTTNKEHRTLLTEVVRYTNEILVLATDIREAHRTKNITWSVAPSNYKPNNGLTFHRTFKSFFDVVLAGIEAQGVGYFNNDNARIIAWRNEQVDDYNRRVRAALGYTETYLVGENLLTGSAIEIPTPRGVPPILIPPDVEFSADEITESTLVEIVNYETIEIPIWTLRVSKPFICDLIVPKERGDANHILSALSTEARNLVSKEKRGKVPMVEIEGKDGKTRWVKPSVAAWARFWAMKRKLGTVRYPYALTAHRSQGSTYQIVHVDMADIMLNSNKREALSCLYVGITRAATHAHVK